MRREVQLYPFAEDFRTHSMFQILEMPLILSTTSGDTGPEEVISEHVRVTPAMSVLSKNSPLLSMPWPKPQEHFSRIQTIENKYDDDRASETSDA